MVRDRRGPRAAVPASAGDTVFRIAASSDSPDFVLPAPASSAPAAPTPPAERPGGSGCCTSSANRTAQESHGSPPTSASLGRPQGPHGAPAGCGRGR